MDTSKLMKNKKFLEFLNTKASFRPVSKTQFAIYDGGDGIFAQNGKIKSNPPKEVGTFICTISYNENEYKKDLDAIAKLWEWRTKRNEKRSVLEEHFGYDTKHLSHTVRLLIGGGNILRTSSYEPRLSGANLLLVKDVLNGKYTYDEVVRMAEELEKGLDKLYEESTIPKTPNHKKANTLLIELSNNY